MSYEDDAPKFTRDEVDGILEQLSFSRRNVVRPIRNSDVDRLLTVPDIERELELTGRTIEEKISVFVGLQAIANEKSFRKIERQAEELEKQIKILAGQYRQAGEMSWEQRLHTGVNEGLLVSSEKVLSLFDLRMARTEVHEPGRAAAALTYYFVTLANLGTIDQAMLIKAGVDLESTEADLGNGVSQVAARKGVNLLPPSTGFNLTGVAGGLSRYFDEELWQFVVAPKTAELIEVVFGQPIAQAADASTS